MNLTSIRSITLLFASATLLSFSPSRAEVAMVDLKAAAEKGSPEAQYKLGLAHRKGEGVKKALFMPTGSPCRRISPRD